MFRVKHKRHLFGLKSFLTVFIRDSQVEISEEILIKNIDLVGEGESHLQTLLLFSDLAISFHSQDQGLPSFSTSQI